MAHNKRDKYIYGSKRNCKICGAEFQPRDKSSDSIYCSYSCNNKSRRIHANRKCSVCKCEFTPIRSDHYTCGRKCGTEFRLSRHVQDPLVIVRKKLAAFSCSLIARCLREKTGKTKAILGYSVEDLRKHLEKKWAKEMNWENYGKKMGQWSIDHIRPISSYSTTHSVSEINALKNLQPMWHRENCSKGGKWDVQ